VDVRTGETVSGFRAEQKDSSAFSGRDEDLRICFGSFDGYFYCLDIHGGQLWKFQADDVVGVMRGYTFAEGLIIFGAQKLFAADIRDGSKVWEFKGNDRFGDTGPLYHKSALFMGAYDGNMYALDAKTGKKIFVFRTGGPVISPPTLDNGILYFGSTDTYLYALDLEQGKTIWTFKTGAPPAPIAWRGWLKSHNPFQRLKRWWKAELPKSAYAKQEEKKVDWAQGYGTGSNPYKMESKDIAYFSGKDREYLQKRDVDKEWREKRGLR
jgi:outer membrane protein assembly factor BamB